MAEKTSHWVGNEFAHDAELLRLQAVERVFDEHTCWLLSERVGVQVGWRCLELGAGAGSIARWLAKQVGPLGSVVAADINCRFLTDLPPNVEVRELDAAVADFGVGEFDVVHHRAVLAYVTGRDKVLARLAASLRPGGWLLSEEGLWRECVIAGDSDDRLLARFLAWFHPMLKAAGTDLLFGAQLRFAFNDLGLLDVGHDGCSKVAEGGDDASGIYWPLVDGLRSSLLTIGGFEEEELGRLVEMLRNPKSRWVTVTVMSAWGRRSG